MVVAVLITMPLKAVVVKVVVVQVHGVMVQVQSVVVQIRTGFRMLNLHPGLIIIGTNAALMRVNIRVVVVVVVHTITPVVVDTVVRVW